MPHTGDAPRILVVDDDSDSRGAVAEMFQVEGYETVEAGHGHEALARLSDGRFDAIILDLNMPVMDGWTFRVAQKANPAFADIPVVVMTSQGDAKARAIDADAFLVKPIVRTALISAVRRAASRREHLASASTAHSDRLSTLGHLAAGVAHELRNPLSYVLSNLNAATSLLEEASRHLQPESDAAALVAESRAALRDADVGVGHLRSLAADLTAFSRTDESGAAVRHCSLSDAVDLSVRLMKPRLRGVRFSQAQIPHQLNVGAARIRLTQVIVNLFANALDAVQSKGSQAQIALQFRQLGDTVFITISDSGPGIPDEIAAQVFEPFFTTKPSGEGTGLGLPLCRALCNDWGGQLKLLPHGGIDAGAAFEVSIPLLANVDAASLPGTNEAVTASGKSPVIAIVDDDPLLLRALVRVVGTQFEAVGATSGDDLLASNPDVDRFHVLLLDFNMPRETGLQLAARVRAMGYRGRTVILTAAPDSPEFVAALQHGFVDRVLAKPWSTTDLLDLLAQFAALPKPS